MKPLLDPQKLDFAIRSRLNVLLISRPGVGKTTLVKQAFDRAGLKLRYFSAPTMDPWVDFVGVPRPVEDDGQTVLDLVPPREFARDEIDAVFLDEFNRAPQKVRNAALELIQFQSINGRKLPRLKMVWAAINPDDDELQTYNVEPMDAAQLDRFHLHLTLPYRPCPAYFVETYGDTGKAALEWWDALGDVQKAKVSPRRLEVALRVHSLGGDLRDVLPEEASARRLQSMLDDGSVFGKLRELLRREDREGARQILEDPDRGTLVLRHVIRSKAAILFYLPLLNPEKRMAMLDHPLVLETMVKFCKRIPEFHDTLQELGVGGNEARKKRVEALAQKFGVPFAFAQNQLLDHFHALTREEIAQYDPFDYIAP